MTFLEKYNQEHPHNLGKDRVVFDACPSLYGYEKKHFCPGTGCAECWGREIPGTENNKKEEPKMATKTKKELMEELKEIKAKFVELNAECEKLECYKQYEECANEFAALRESFVNAGFNKDEAFMLVRDVFVSQVKSVLG